MVLPAGLEPATLCLEDRCSIQLSYGSLQVDDDFFLMKNQYKIKSPFSDSFQSCHLAFDFLALLYWDLQTANLCF